MPQNLVLNFWTWSKCQTRWFFLLFFFLKWVLNLVYIILKFYYSEKCKLYLEVSWKRFSTEKVIFPISGAVHFVQWDEIFFQTPYLSNCLDFCSGAASVESRAELWDVYEVHSSLPRCNTDAQFQMLRSVVRLRSKSLPSVFGRLFNRRISLPIVHFISNTIEKEKKKI